MSSAIVWGTQVGTSSTYELKSAYFDNTAPTLGGFTTANLVATKPASFSVTTSDRWTTAPTVTWDFDDGTTGTGTNPTHTYALPGNYRVTITTTDEFGNSFSQGAADHGGPGTGHRWEHRRDRRDHTAAGTWPTYRARPSARAKRGVTITCTAPQAPDRRGDAVCHAPQVRGDWHRREDLRAEGRKHEGLELQAHLHAEEAPEEGQVQPTGRSERPRRQRHPDGDVHP